MKKISKIYSPLLKPEIHKKSWWFPVWSGLVTDSTAGHRIKIGSSLWLYLYLLFSANRKTGTVLKKQKEMADDLGFSVRTIQKHLLRLVSGGYIIIDSQSKPLKIKITKWKLFNRL